MFQSTTIFFLRLFGLLWLTLPGAQLGAQEGAEARVVDDAPSAVELAAGTAVEESWFRVDVSGQAAGWMVERSITDGERVISESDLQISFRRGGSALRLGMSSRFTETADHEPLEMWTRQQLGAAPQETVYRFDDAGVLMNGEKRLDRPAGSWLTPAAVDRRLEQEIGALLERGAPDGGVISIEIEALDPSLGLQVITTRWVLEEKAVQVELDGERHVASRWRQSQSFAPQIESVIYLDEDGEMLQSTTPLMGLEMRFVRTTEEKAHALGDGPELLVQSFIYPNRRIDNPRGLRRGVYRVTVDGEPVELPELGAQRRDGDKIVVDLDRPIRETLESPEGLLAPSTYFDFEAPEVAELLATVLEQRERAGAAQQPSPAQRAEALRRLVHRHLHEKNLDSILATAGEAAASRSGDCTEHAVLLTALLRADGIPARTATGVIYVDAFAGKRHLFAYHMWSQAYWQGRWHDLDATLPPETAFDAAHITFDVPNLDDEGAALMHMAGVAPLIGRAEIEVLHGGGSESGEAP